MYPSKSFYILISTYTICLNIVCVNSMVVYITCFLITYSYMDTEQFDEAVRDYEKVNTLSRSRGNWKLSVIY